VNFAAVGDKDFVGGQIGFEIEGVPVLPIMIENPNLVAVIAM
jgi:hypothetical protein